MKSEALVLALIAILLSACSSPTFMAATSHATPTASPPPSSDFPLTEGAYWVYEGLAKWDRSGEVVQRTVSLKMQVLEKVEREPFTAYLMSGNPLDLTWFEGGTLPGPSLIVRTTPNRFYRAEMGVLGRLKDKNDDLTNLVKEEGLFLDLPLYPEKRFCPARDLAREDGMYCWLEGDPEQVRLEGIKGISMAQPITLYDVQFRTLSDYQSIQFAPGIGITRYQYIHHGTVSEVNVKLTEYRAGAP